MKNYGFFNSDHYSMHSQIVRYIDTQKKVLDVGCADGHLSKSIKTKGCEVIGIEIDEKAAKNATKYCEEVFCGDIEHINLHNKYEKYFDFIIFADVLEHLKEPSIVLQKFKKYLKDDGHILVSLPNISNWRIRIKLLFGNFEYEDKGLLDSGHLRFFNEKSAKKLLLDSGFEICKFDLTVGDMPKFAKFFHSVGMFWPNLLAYQFLIIAKKS